MNPMLFGDADRRLFGVYTPAAGQRRRMGAVICPPFGQEYLRSHRACRALGDRLAAAGIDVLRFDYYGSGDSAGDSHDVTLAGCIDDARHAVDELAAVAAVRNIVAVGLRLGAAVALSVARTTSIVNRCVLWDPVLDGSAYADALLSGANGGTPVYAGGFPVPVTFEQELRALAPAGLMADVRSRLLIVSQPDVAATALVPDAADRNVDYATFDGPPAWLEQGDLGVGVLPVRALEFMTRWCAP